MSSSGERKDEDVRASDDEESETHEPPKKVAKPDKFEDIFICNISKNRRVFVRNCKGRITIGIRQFRVKDGQTLFCKKGVNLSLDQWNDLRNHEEDIDEALSDPS